MKGQMRAVYDLPLELLVDKESTSFAAHVVSGLVVWLAIPLSTTQTQSCLKSCISCYQTLVWKCLGDSGSRWNNWVQGQKQHWNQLGHSTNESVHSFEQVLVLWVWAHGRLLVCGFICAVYILDAKKLSATFSFVSEARLCNFLSQSQAIDFIMKEVELFGNYGSTILIYLKHWEKKGIVIDESMVHYIQSTNPLTALDL